MAVNIFDRYGIKEVANVYFEALEDEPRANIYKGDIVLFLDSLKVSTIETTAEQTDARGGWGNPKLVTWDYGKEITLTLEDALLSLESLRFMMGGAIHRSGVNNEKVLVRYTEEVIAGDGGEIPFPTDHLTNKPFARNISASADHPIRLINLGGTDATSSTAGTRSQIVTAKTFEAGEGATLGKIQFKNDAMGVASATVANKGDRIRIFWEEEVAAGNANADKDYAVEVSISPDTFPGTYRVVGDTFMRSAETGSDEAFQFVINKAKVSSEVTLTLEAEGDPATFEMTLTVLRGESDRGGTEMMKLIRYGAGSAGAGKLDGDDHATPGQS